MDNDKDNHKTFFISISSRVLRIQSDMKKLNPERILGQPNFIFHKNYVKQVVHECSWSKTLSEIGTCLWMKIV